MEKKKKSHVLSNILLVICLLVFLGSGGMLVKRVLDQKANDSRLDSLSDQLMAEAAAAAGITLPENFDGSLETAAAEGSGAENGDAATETTAAPALTPEQLQALREARIQTFPKIKGLNPDMVGWIRIIGTKIDYPVVQSLQSPDYYLNHNFDRARSIYGCPYVAEECDLSGDCRNILIYGHHMKNGSMFAALDKYLSKSFWQQHPNVEFDTLEASGDYQIMAVFRMSAQDASNPIYNLITAGTEDSFNQYVSYVKNQSVYDTGITAGWGDHLISLITCEYTRKDGRLIVVAKKV